MCTCDKCGASVCQYCKRGDCAGANECLQAKVDRLERRVKELELQTQPIITITPYPYPLWQPYPTVPINPWNPVYFGDTVQIKNATVIVSTPIECAADGSVSSHYLS